MVSLAILTQSLGNLACPCNKYWARITKFASNVHLVDISAIIENEVIDLTFKVISPESKKRRSTSLLYTDLGQPRGVTPPERALVRGLLSQIHWKYVPEPVYSMLF